MNIRVLFPLTVKKFWLVFLVGALIPAPAFATEAYEFAKTAINSYAIVKDATSTPLPQNLGAMETVRASLQSSIKQRRAFQLADIQIQKFKESDDAEIRQVVALMSAPFTLLAILQEQITTECEKILNTPQATAIAEQGTLYKRIFELQEEANANWELYIKTSGVAGFALSDSSRPVDGKLHYLKITTAERAELKKQLLAKFGKSVRDGVTSKTGPNAAPAIKMWEFLNDNWATADSK